MLFWFQCSEIIFACIFCVFSESMMFFFHQNRKKVLQSACVAHTQRRNKYTNNGTKKTKRLCVARIQWTAFFIALSNLRARAQSHYACPGFGPFFRRFHANSPFRHIIRISIHSCRFTTHSLFIHFQHQTHFYGKQEKKTTYIFFHAIIHDFAHRGTKPKSRNVYVMHQ